MSLYENEEKKSNAGFVKVIEKKENWEVQVQLLGVPAIFDGQGVLEIRDGETSLRQEVVLLQGGMATTCYTCGKEGELNRLLFVVRLSEGCVLASGRIQEQKASPSVVPDPEPVEEDDIWQEMEILEPMEDNPVKEELEVQEDMVQQSVPQKEEGKEKVESRKWKQICKAYPHIRPFDDFREYIKLELRDMVLVSEKKYSLVENSFLLHGYYNYGHLILWKKEKAPVKYYVGVPGNFYDKEKQVAVLYGFESFEGAVEPAREGDFGYYMTEVSL